nr:uncharacterized protein LOC109189731 [Ipomoea trifida]
MPCRSSNTIHSGMSRKVLSGAFKTPVTENVIGPAHGPLNLTGFSKNSPLGTATVLWLSLHASIHASTFFFRRLDLLIEDPAMELIASAHTEKRERRRRGDGELIACAHAETEREVDEATASDRVRRGITEAGKGKRSSSSPPKEILALVNRSMLFRISVRKDQFSNFPTSFPVLRVNTDQQLLAQLRPEILSLKEDDLNTDLQLSDGDDDFLEVHAEIAVAVDILYK